MADMTLKQGDLGRPLEVTLTDAAGNPVILESVRIVMEDAYKRNVIDADMTAANALLGQWRYAWQEGDTDRAGTYRCEFVGLDLDGKEITFPSDPVGPYTIIQILRQVTEAAVTEPE